MEYNSFKKFNKLIFILAIVGAIIGSIIIIVDYSAFFITNDNGGEKALMSFASPVPAHASMPAIVVSPTRTPLDPDKTWFTLEEMLGAFGPAPTPILDNATTTVLLKKGGIAYPYPNGTLAYYTDYDGARDPTTDQIIAFLATDNTYKQHNLTEGQFVCVNFAVMLHDRMESYGIKSHLASLLFSSGQLSSGGHMINAFNTTDAGWVYVDATDNGWILIGPIHSGDKYQGTLMKNQDGKWGFFSTETGNVIGNVEII